MRICFLEIQPFPYNIGGGTTYLLKISKYLIKLGHTVSIITSKAGNKQKRLPIPKGLKVYSVGIPHKVFRKSSLSQTIASLLYRALWEVSWIIASTKKLKEVNPDICNPQSSITTALPCSLSGKIFVVNEHGVHLDGFRKLWSERKSRIVVHLASLYGLLESYNCKKAKRIFCVSNDTYEFYKKFGRSKCVILPHAVDFDNFPKINFSKKKDYLFVGRLTEQKGVNYLIEAMEILDKEGVELTLNIIGEGEPSYVDPLRKKVDHFKHVKINFLGFLTGNKLYDYYKKSSVFISSSIFEPFGLVILEAMAAGCGIISADHEGGKLLVKPSFGKVVSFKDKEKRAKNLANVIKESIKWNTFKMGENARISARKYSYEKLADTYSKYYQEVIKESNQ